MNLLLFLYAIAEVESGQCDLAVGTRGEVGRYQMMPATWRQYTNAPLAAAQQYPIARSVALQHLAAIAKGVGDDPYRCAIAWNRGVGYAQKHPEARSDYAQRVVNLYEVYTKQEKGTKREPVRVH